jgi:DNA (cytosine-5)-methyltransferase 1
MVYGSVCSGIEAASVAWHPLGWRASFLSEIEKFPRAVLKHHWPDAPLHGDFTAIESDQYEPIDLLVAGTPCQSFSIAGLRGGMADERGNLALEYLRLARRLGPRWLVWENVPGVLSSNGGRDFGSILGGFRELGYGFAYRVLDAQYVRVDGHPGAVPQRRKRVFVVGYLGDWRRAAAVLFERASLSGHPAPRRETGESIAHTVAPSIGHSGRGFERAGETRGQDPVIAVGIPAVSPTINVRDYKGPYRDGDEHRLVPVAMSNRGIATGDVAETIQSDCHGALPPAIAFHGSQDPDVSGDVAHPLGMNGGLEACVAFSCKDYGADAGETAPVGGNQGGDYVADTLSVGANQTTGFKSDICTDGYAVRRLTPRECERLQGFPDDYTQIPWRGKDADDCPDGPRYKALGNSMAVNVMRWIGRRIEMVELLT